MRLQQPSGSGLCEARGCEPAGFFGRGPSQRSSAPLAFAYLFSPAAATHPRPKAERAQAVGEVGEPRELSPAMPRRQRGFPFSFLSTAHREARVPGSVTRGGLPTGKPAHSSLATHPVRFHARPRRRGPGLGLPMMGMPIRPGHHRTESIMHRFPVGRMGRGGFARAVTRSVRAIESDSGPSPSPGECSLPDYVVLNDKPSR